MIIFRNIDDPEVLETMAIREALALVDDLYIQRVHVASDCRTAIASFGAIVHEIKARATSFLSSIFIHEFRTSNIEAHKLGKHALTLGVDRHVWLDHPGDL